MNTFALNLLLAAGWAMLTGTATIPTLMIGFVIGYAILWLLGPLMGPRSGYFMRVWYWIRLIVMFNYELVVASVQVLWDIVTPRHRARPGLIEMPLDVTTDAGILMVTNLISLTPGTLSLDVSEDRRTLLIHAMFADDPDAICRQLKGGMERWVREAIE